MKILLIKGFATTGLCDPPQRRQRTSALNLPITGLHRHAFFFTSEVSLLGVTACVFRNSTNDANEDKVVGIDRRTGRTLFRDDRAFNRSVVAGESIGNAAEIAALADALSFSQESEPLLLTFLMNGSHSGDVIPLDRIGLVTESASTLLSRHQLEPEVAIFLKKVRRLCSAAQLEDNPIVFV
jgi:hypothetical protein